MRHGLVSCALAQAVVSPFALPPSLLSLVRAFGLYSQNNFATFCAPPSFEISWDRTQLEGRGGKKKRSCCWAGGLSRINAIGIEEEQSQLEVRIWNYAVYARPAPSPLPPIPPSTSSPKLPALALKLQHNYARPCTCACFWLLLHQQDSIWSSPSFFSPIYM